MTQPFRPAVLIPTYNNPQTIRTVVLRAREYLKDVVVIDDASASEGERAVRALGDEGLAHVFRRPTNGGKGAAVKTGFEVAHQLGYTHVVQVDADGQHALEDIPTFVAAAKENPSALVLGQPQFDESAPLGRRLGRKISLFWVWLECGGDVVGDPLCGFRLYPVAAARRADAQGDRMDFDPEIAVRIVWTGAPVVHVPTRVRYLSAAEGGVSHFRAKDNWLIAKLHARLMTWKIFAWVMRKPLVAALPERTD